MNTDNDMPPPSQVLRTADLPGSAPVPVLLVPGPEARAALARQLGLLGLRKLRFEGRLEPLDQRDWRLTAHLGATVVQPCVVTLAPVTTRIDEPVERIWRADMTPADVEPDAEIEIPEGTDDEPLGSEIDLGQVMAEALALALPLYPRTEGVGIAEATFAGPGVTPMSDEDSRPFAGLAGLRSKLEGGKKDDPDG